MSRQFSATKTAKRNNVTAELRLLTQPVYRYPDKPQDVLDGALFVFVRGTDAELLLLLEVRKTGDRLRWEYALARQSQGLLRVFHGEREIWKAPLIQNPHTPGRRKAYVRFFYPSIEAALRR